MTLAYTSLYLAVANLLFLIGHLEDMDEWRIVFGIGTNRPVCLSWCFIDFLIETDFSAASNKALRGAWPLHLVVGGATIPQRTSDAKAHAHEGAFSGISVHQSAGQTRNSKRGEDEAVWVRRRGKRKKPMETIDEMLTLILSRVEQDRRDREQDHRRSERRLDVLLEEAQIVVQ